MKLVAVKKIYCCAECGKEFKTQDVEMTAEDFDRKCDDDPDNAYTEGTVGNEVNKLFDNNQFCEACL